MVSICFSLNQTSFQMYLVLCCKARVFALSFQHVYGFLDRRDCPGCVERADGNVSC